MKAKLIIIPGFPELRDKIETVVVPPFSRIFDVIVLGTEESLPDLSREEVNLLCYSAGAIKGVEFLKHSPLAFNQIYFIDPAGYCGSKSILIHSWRFLLELQGATHLRQDIFKELAKKAKNPLYLLSLTRNIVNFNLKNYENKIQLG